MKIKQVVMYGLFAILLALAINACPTDSDPTNRETDSEDDTVITYRVEQTDGVDGERNTTGIVFTFSASIDDLDLTAADITVDGRAEKGSEELNGSETSWTLPITVREAGLAAIAITKEGIETEIKYVIVYKDGQPAPEAVTITWYLNGGEAGTNAPHPAQIEIGEMLAEPSPAPTRGDDVFVGWYTNSSLTQEYDFTNPVTANLNLYAKWIRDLGTPAKGGTLAEKLEWVKNAANVENGKTYTIEVNANEAIATQTLSYTNRSGIAIILKSTEEERIISLSENDSGSLFVLESGVTLVLGKNITLKGRVSESSSLVRVNSGGTFEMETDSKIADNTTFSSTYVTYGGGVHVSGGTFTMNGGEITGNTASSLSSYGAYGGGVHVSGGTFIMNNGKISGNTANNGGGVYVSDGIFTMYGGEISGNTALENGGGVYVRGGTFNNAGGEISGNTPPENDE